MTPTKPGVCTRPFFGVDAAVVDQQGHEVPANAGGLVCDPQAVAFDAADDLGR